VEQSIGTALGLLAKKKNITQEAVAKSVNISRISVNRFFRGHTQIRATDFTRVCLLLGVDIEKQINDQLIS
jgi:transcriptional regulator with XRE-family HTH domain